MARLTVLDASILLAHLDAHDPHNADAGQILASDDDFLVSTVTLAEALVGAARAGLLEEHLAAFAAFDITEFPPAAGAGAELATLRAQTGLKLPDCCVLHAAISTNAGAVATRDARLATVVAERGFQAP